LISSINFKFRVLILFSVPQNSTRSEEFLLVWGSKQAKIFSLCFPQKAKRDQLKISLLFEKKFCDWVWDVILLPKVLVSFWKSMKQSSHLNFLFVYRKLSHSHSLKIIRFTKRWLISNYVQWDLHIIVLKFGIGKPINNWVWSKLKRIVSCISILHSQNWFLSVYQTDFIYYHSVICCHID
jgi:hypothetical protein